MTELTANDLPEGFGFEPDAGPTCTMTEDSSLGLVGKLD